MSEVFASVVDFIRSVTRENKTYCCNLARSALSATGHIPVAYNVARGAGFCAYFARLVEAIGVREAVSTRISGKGRDVHKVLGLASLHIFRDKILPPQSIRLDESINYAATILRRVNSSTHLDNESLNIARVMLQNLITNIPRFLQILDANNEPFIPIVEQQLADYEVHIRGVPDLILENREQRKAIVVEWKTSRETPAHWEEAQVLAYSLLAARRLGFETKEAIEAILGRLNSSEIFEDVHVLPVIIRPTTTERAIIKPHPALSGLTGIALREYIQEFRRLLYNVVVEAEHLTLLNTNISSLTSVEESNQARRRCVAVTQDGHEVFSLRYTPRQLPRGRPEEQQTFPCTVCPESIREACSFYFGRGFGKLDEFDKAMWALRFKAYEKLESILLTYKAIHEIFSKKGRDNVIDWLKQGMKIIWDGVYPRLENKRPPSIEVYRKGRLFSRIRIDLLEDFDGFDTDVRTLVVRRPLREFEREDLPAVLYEDKTAMLVLLDVDNPLLAPNLFCRVEEVYVGEREVKYTLGLPSAVFDYQYHLLRSYVEDNVIDDYQILLVEVGANLLHLELKAIDIMQRAMREDALFQEDASYYQLIERLIDEARQEEVNAYYGEAGGIIDTLRSIIRAGHASRRQRT